MKNLEENKTGIYKEKEVPSLWKWYFSWNFRSLITIPLFLFFIYHGIYFIFVEIQDVFLFFQTPVTWGRLLLIIFAGIFMIWIVLAPIYISFASIDWLYKINIGDDTKRNKILKSIGIILLVAFGAGIISMFSAWILGIF